MKIRYSQTKPNLNNIYLHEVLEENFQPKEFNLIQENTGNNLRLENQKRGNTYTLTHALPPPPTSQLQEQAQN